MHLGRFSVLPLLRYAVPMHPVGGIDLHGRLEADEEAAALNTG